jgi:hypothetical protein
MVDGPCSTHIIHREIEVFFKHKELIPKLHCVAWSCTLANMSVSIRAALHAIVKEDLWYSSTSQLGVCKYQPTVFQALFPIVVVVATCAPMKSQSQRSQSSVRKWYFRHQISYTSS